nr:NADH dehydrogenase subunit 4L [Hypselosoma matsumurae]
MINYYNVFLLLIFISGITVFCSSHKHLLLTLLSLEYLISIMFMMFIIFFCNYYMESYFLLIFLTFSVCEGAIGLSILILLIRVHGGDYISSISFMKW